MSLATAMPELDRAGLRRFGLTLGAAFAMLFGLLLPWLLGRPLPWWPWLLAAVLASLGLVLPGALRPVFRFWMRFGILMSRVTTPLVLGIVFFGLFTPTALFFRLVKRDSMRRHIDNSADSYRIVSEKHPRERLERPF